MFIERFNHIKECFEFNPSTGEGTLLQRDNQEFSGIGDVYDGTIAAVYVLNQKPYLQIGSISVDLYHMDYKLRHSHINREKTVFSIKKNSEILAEIYYPSWMDKMKNFPIGLGLPEDDEEDFFAYIKLILENKKMASVFVNRWNGSFDAIANPSSILDEISNFIEELKPLRNIPEACNEIIGCFRKYQGIFIDIDNLLAISGSLLSSKESAIRDELAFCLDCAIKHLLRSNIPEARDILSIIFDEISSIKLIQYKPKVIINCHKGYFIARYTKELRELFSKNNDNKSYPLSNAAIEELAEESPAIAKQILPLIFDKRWGFAYRTAAAIALVKANCSEEICLQYSGIENKDFSNEVLSKISCFPILIEALKYHSTGGMAVHIEKDIVPLEQQISLLIIKYNNKSENEFLKNKWQCSDWKTKIITLSCGWKFTFRRVPYNELCELRIPGYENRDGVFSSYPEQLSWLEEKLYKSNLGKYSSSWKLDFLLHGETLLQHLLDKISEKEIKNIEFSKANTIFDSMQ